MFSDQDDSITNAPSPIRTMNVNFKFIVVFLTVLIAASSSRSLRADQPPNIVFIIADDLRFDLLACNGHPHAQTPNIDRLAAEGANFVNAFAVTPLCSPSRASFLTGLYPHQHRIVNNDDQGLDVVSHRLMTFPRILREQADYLTAYIGKWHMGFDDSRRPGFDHWISCKGQGQFVDPVVNVNGVQQQTDGYLTDLITDWSVEFLQQAHDRPFCLYVSHEAVHAPFIPAQRHETLYADVTVETPPADPQALKGKRALTRPLPDRPFPGWYDLTDASPEPVEARRGRPTDRNSIVQDQLRCLTAVDEGVGRIYEVLQRKGLLDETLIIFTSDQGYLHGEHGLFRDKRWPYDPCLRIPFIIRYPSLVRSATVVDDMVLSLDVAPTLLELANVDPLTPLSGRSFVPKLQDPSAPWRDSFLFEYFVEKVTPRCPTYFAVRTADWKYIHYPGLDGMDEMYNLADDPGEQTNLIDDPAHAAARERLREELDRLNDVTQNSFPMSLE